MFGAKQIIKKEMTRVFTDKKLIISLFILPAVLIIGIYYFLGQMQTAMMNDINKHVSTIYIQNVPEDFKDIITSSKLEATIKYLKPGADLTKVKEGILNGNTDLLVVFEEDFLNKVNAYKKSNTIPEVKTYYNTSEDYSNAARENFVNVVLTAYEQKLLKERFGNVNQLTVFHTDVDPSTSVIVDEKKATGKIFGTLLPYLITFMLFQGAMSLGIDAITGEKERGTMASMLLTPLKRREIVVGKLISISILASLSAAVYAVSMIAAMPVMLKNLGEDSMEGLSLKFSAIQAAELLAILIVMVYLYVSVVALAAVLAKTAKEAAAYVTPILIVVIVAGMATMFSGNEEKALSSFAIPVYGSAISIQNILVGELTLPQFGATIGGTLLLAVFLTVLITRAFNSEKVMFNA
ncbi:ABC transporter permease [Anaerocolumna sedimenticola]|uniref:ABC transporter permease n=1 Tax=Anaerocolumna sedimenticola TaxID=2696063 RepID=A0A6P1TK48_9FIRM|nr:ABC transporter permease [Anaerocolumna sedimenticola]QHQ60482.1 ABC transporter permease [Anaerocolumna sedimenticola]